MKRNPRAENGPYPMTRWTMTGAAALLSTMLLTAPAFAQAGGTLRDFNTDRPDTTESPFTVDRGHFQLELSLAEWTRDRADGVTTDSWSVLPLNLRYGFSDHAELDLMVDPYDRSSTSGAGLPRSTAKGFGGTTVRVKWNLWGDDGGKTAFALLPYLTLPTASRELGSRNVEGGLVLPFAVSLDEHTDLSAMVVVDVPRNQADDGWAPDIVHSLSLGHDFGAGWGGYVELAGFWSPSHDQDYRGTFDTGVTLGLGENSQVDAGVRLGLTRAADDVAAFVGAAWRF